MLAPVWVQVNPRSGRVYRDPCQRTYHGGMTTRVGPMVATLARARGMTTSDLALATGIHRNRLADKIAGRRAFTEGEIVGLADVLGVPPSKLFDDPLALLTGGSSSACVRIFAGQRHLRAA